MDHGGGFEQEGSVVMSHVQVGGVDLCDNLTNPEAPAAQTGNLNQTKQSPLLPLRSDDGGHRGDGEEMEREESRRGEAYPGTGRGEGEGEEEEEDTDQVMKEEEEDESEESGCVIRCLSPDTPMTDSSFSETGSLLEPPYPPSPGTSPEPPSPDLDPSQGHTQAIPPHVDTQSAALDPGPRGKLAPPGSPAGPTDDPTTLPPPVTSDGASYGDPPGPTSCPPQQAAHSRLLRAELTSSTEEAVLLLTPGPTDASSSSTAETFTGTKLSTSSSASNPTSETATGGPSSTAGPTTTSHPEHVITSSAPAPACATGPTLPTPALLESLERLAQTGDDTHLPQYLHQIAEAFVLHQDYQRALWCVQLERLYHQRVLDNLSALQRQWESQCERTSSDLATQHLDTLTHICRTHNRPRARDAVCASVDFVKPTFKEGGALPPCTSGMEQGLAEASPSINQAEKDRDDPDGEPQGGASVPGCQPSDRAGGAGAGDTIPPVGDHPHPSTAGDMDQSEPAKQQQQQQEEGGGVGGLDPATEKEEAIGEKGQEGEEEEEVVQSADEASEMEQDGEKEEEKEKRALPVETVGSGSDVELQQLDKQEVLTEEKPHEDTQGCEQDAHGEEARLEQREQQEQQPMEEPEEYEEFEFDLEQADLIRQAARLDHMARLITVEEMSPASGLVSILKKPGASVGSVSVSAASKQKPEQPPAKRRVRFRVSDDGYEPGEVGGGDSCLLLFLLCMVTVVISVGGTALYCALGDVHSSVCQDFSRNADFYTVQIQRGIAQLQHWFAPGS